MKPGERNRLRLEYFENVYSEEEPEEPKKKKAPTVKPWYFPGEVVALFYNGTISPRELVLLGIINALTGTRADGSVKKCFASNKFLAKQSRLSIPQVRKVLYHLVESGIVIRTEKEKPNGRSQRYLRPFWRRSKPAK